MNEPGGLFFYLVGILPEFLVWILALTFLLATWKGGSKARLLAVGALVLEIVSTPLFAAAYSILPRMAASSMGMDGRGVSFLFRVVGLAHSLVAAGAWALVLAAFFLALKTAENPLSPPVARDL